MNDGQITYRKLCRKWGLFDSSTLTETDDHFLLVSGLGYQTYRRFFFDKIQSIQVRPTKNLYFHIAIPLLIGLLIAFVMTFAVIDPIVIEGFPVMSSIFAIFLAPFALYSLVHVVQWLLFGASQEVIIQTAVQRTVIPPLGYRRQSRAILTYMAGRVEQVQGQASQEGLLQALKAWEPASTNAAVSRLSA